jgi:hypothetical protein
MSHPFKAERTDIFVGIESTQKTEATLERYPGLLKDGQEIADPEIEWLEERVVGGDREVYQHVEGPRAFEGGSWTIVPYDGWPIAWLLGGESTNGTSPTTHTLTAKSDGEPPTATVEANYLGQSGQDDFSRGLLGALPESGTIEVNNEEELQVTLSNIALGITSDTKDGTRSATTGISLPDREVWSFKKVKSDLSLFGTTFARVVDFSLEVTNNPTPDRYLESTEAPEPYEMTYGNVEYSLELEIAITDDALYQELVNPSSDGFDMSITFEKGSNGDETLKLEASNLRMSEAPHEIPGEGKVTVSPTITPRTITVTVKDSTSSGTGYLS